MSSQALLGGNKKCLLICGETEKGGTVKKKNFALFTMRSINTCPIKAQCPIRSVDKNMQFQN